MLKRLFHILSRVLPKITISSLMGAVDLNAKNICQCAMENDG